MIKQTLLKILTLAFLFPTFSSKAFAAGFGTVSLPGDLEQTTNPSCLLNSIIGIVIALAGIVFLFFLILGGIRMMTAAGDEKAAASARSSVTTGLLGFILVIAAWFIAKFIGEVLGIPILNPNIPGIPIPTC